MDESRAGIKSRFGREPGAAYVAGSAAEDKHSAKISFVSILWTFGKLGMAL